MVPRQQCAFIQYTTRAAAELAAEKTFNKLILGGRRLTIKWGRSQGRQGLMIGAGGALDPLEPVPGLPGALPVPPGELAHNFFNLEPGRIPLPGAVPPPPQLVVPPVFGHAPPVPPFFFGPPVQAPSAFVPPAAAAELGPSTSTAAKPVVHYPSQDPSRLGATQLNADRQE